MRLAFLKEPLGGAGSGAAALRADVPLHLQRSVLRLHARLNAQTGRPPDYSLCDQAVTVYPQDAEKHVSRTVIHGVHLDFKSRHITAPFWLYPFAAFSCATFSFFVKSGIDPQNGLQPVTHLCNTF